MKNIAGMLQKAQLLQSKMTEMQAELKTREVIKPDEADLLEDLVLAAFNDAREKVTRMVEEEMGKLSGGMGLPKGLF